MDPFRCLIFNVAPRVQSDLIFGILSLILYSTNLDNIDYIVGK